MRRSHVPAALACVHEAVGRFAVVRVICALRTAAGMVLSSGEATLRLSR
jgi:hypothetical protein